MRIVTSNMDKLRHMLLNSDYKSWYQLFPLSETDCRHRSMRQCLTNFSSSSFWFIILTCSTVTRHDQYFAAQGCKPIGGANPSRSPDKKNVILRVAGAMDSVSQTCGFVSKTMMAGVGREEDLQRCMWRGQRSTRNISIRHVKRSGRWFPRGVTLWRIRFQVCFAWQVQHFVWPGFTFSPKAQYFIGVEIFSKRICTRPSALHSTFHFWRKSRRTALCPRLFNSNINELALNFFLLDLSASTFEGSLAYIIASFQIEWQIWRQKRRQINKVTDR